MSFNVAKSRFRFLLSNSYQSRIDRVIYSVLEVGAKRVLFESQKVDMSRTGQFINCEDGLQIPW